MIIDMKQEYELFSLVIKNVKGVEANRNLVQEPSKECKIEAGNKAGRGFICV